MDADCEVTTSEVLQDAEWDAFVAGAGGGHHVQTSLWAQVKALLGWRAIRVIASRGGRIVAGAQLLVRTYPVLGRIGYVTKGPVHDAEHAAASELVIDALCREGERRRIWLLAVQPPNNGAALTRLLLSRGFSASSIELAPAATILIDLEPPLEDILSRMKRQTRQNIRRSEREGIVVEEGSERDLHVFYELSVATSRRQGFPVYPEEYFALMWRLFQPRGHAALLIARSGLEPVSSLMLVPFGDTVIAKTLGWSGLYPERRPNDGLFWAAIQWSRSHGYRWFDFEGIDPAGARAVLDGQSLPESLQHSPDFFKLGYGGQVVLYPEAYDRVRNPVLRSVYRRASPRVGGDSAASKLMDRLRKR